MSCHHIRHDDKCNHFCTSWPESQNLLGIKNGKAKTEIFSQKSTCSCHLEKIRRNRNCLFHSSFPYTNWWYLNHGFFRCEEKKNSWFNAFKCYFLGNRLKSKYRNYFANPIFRKLIPLNLRQVESQCLLLKLDWKFPDQSTLQQVRP